MTEPKMYPYWNKTTEPSQLQHRVAKIIEEIQTHIVTRGEIKDMQNEGFLMQTLETATKGYYVSRPKGPFMPSSYYIKVFLREEDAWQDAWVDYAVFVLIPKSINKEV